MCHTYRFSLFLNNVLQVIRSKNFSSLTRFSFIRNFLSYSYCSLKQIRLKNNDQKRGKCHTGGGVRKVPTKKCHVLFEWLLRVIETFKIIIKKLQNFDKRNLYFGK
jgi:hypothetical protein